MKKGFTLIELMVASLLLAMLVTILTMMFNQSSIAWRTGTAGVAKLNVSRRALGAFHDIRDEVLPGLGQKDAVGGSGDDRTILYRTIPLWNDTQGDGKLIRGRAFESVEWDKATEFSIGDAMIAKKCDVINKTSSSGGSSLFTVGVRSAGPNRRYGDGDDITTWPDDEDIE